MLDPTHVLRAAAGRQFERQVRRSDRPIGLVLMYHEVAWEPGDPAREVFPALGAGLFRDQLRHLQRHYEVVSLAQLAERAAQRSPGDPLPVALTFDDDYSRHATVAAPILGELGFTATFFLCGNSLRGPAPFWWQDLQVILNRGDDAWPKLRAELARDWPWATLEAEVRDLTNTIEAAPQKIHDAIVARLRELAGPQLLDEGLSAEAVRGLAGAGFEIGFHTRRHYRLETLDGRALDRALTEGLDDLADVLGRSPTTIAYPHAKAELRVAAAAQRAGFEHGYLLGDIPTTPAQHPLLRSRVGGQTASLAAFQWVLGRAGSRG